MQVIGAIIFAVIVLIFFKGCHMNDDVYSMYEMNDEFKLYVDRYAKSRGISVEVALTHAVVRQYAKYLGER